MRCRFDRLLPASIPELFPVRITGMGKDDPPRAIDNRSQPRRIKGTRHVRRTTSLGSETWNQQPAVR